MCAAAPSACLQIKVVQSPSVRDAFVSEIVKLSPPGLKLLDLKAAQNLHKWVHPGWSCTAQLAAACLLRALAGRCGQCAAFCWSLHTAVAH